MSSRLAGARPRHGERIGGRSRKGVRNAGWLPLVETFCTGEHIRFDANQRLLLLTQITAGPIPVNCGWPNMTARWSVPS